MDFDCISLCQMLYGDYQFTIKSSSPKMLQSAFLLKNTKCTVMIDKKCKKIDNLTFENLIK